MVSLVGKALEAALLVGSLGPELRDAVVALIRAIRDGDDKAERRALEAARRLAFKARQRR